MLERPDTRKHGCVAGACNYSLEDLNALFNILEVCLPLGGHAWNSAGDEFNSWAKENGYPVCTVKSLEAKFKQVSYCECKHATYYSSHNVHIYCAVAEKFQSQVQSRFMAKTFTVLYTGLSTGVEWSVTARGRTLGVLCMAFHLETQGTPELWDWIQVCRREKKFQKLGRYKHATYYSSHNVHIYCAITENITSQLYDLLV